MKTPTHIVIHHTAVSYSKNADQWQATDNYHKEKWGIKSALGYYGGYNYEIAKDGSLKQFREDGEETVAQYQQNMNDGRAISICLDGNFDEELPTEEQKKTLIKFLQEKMEAYQIPEENIITHRSLANYKTCPGKLLSDDIYHYFISMPENSSNQKQSNILPWAKEACDWAIKNRLISDTKNLDEHKQWTLVVLYRYDKINKK